MQSAANPVLHCFAASAVTWTYATDVTYVTAKTACTLHTVNVAIKSDVWTVCHIGIVPNAISQTVVIARMHKTFSGAKSAMKNIAMTAVSRIIIMTTLNVQVVVVYCFRESCMREKS